ncbi:MAG: methyl-accepting chemotaxis protein [Lachnospiraceae bacterium]
MKSIKTKILIPMILTVVISLIAVGGAACTFGYLGTTATLEASMKKTAEVAADRVSYELKAYKNIATEAGMLYQLSSPAIPLDTKKELLQQKADTYGLQRYNLLDANGVSIIDGNDYSDRDYFKAAINGTTYVSEPLVSAVTGEMTIIIAAPVWQNGQSGSKVTGVVYFVPKETFLNDIVSSLTISRGGAAYMLDANGTTIAHRNIENVRNQENTIASAQTDSSLSGLAQIESRMISGASGFGRYRYGGEKKFTAFAPIPDTNGWSISINAPVSDFTQSTMYGIIIVLILLIVSVVIAVLLSVRLSNNIANPIRACAERLRLLAQGDLDTSVPDFHSDDEVGILVSSTRTIVDALKAILKDIDYLLEEMGSGNFVVDSQVSDLYIGSFAPLLSSIRQIKHRLSNVLLQINVSADQIASGASQVSDGAQALAQGSTEQASSVQELAATVHEISNNSSETASVARKSQHRAQEAGSHVVRSNEMMGQMTVAMDEISDFSKKIGNIITTIEDIAFQTNILALNAAVEAARAGSAGKGFAVVADEVRNLASKSDQAAKATKELIENSVESVQNGSSIVVNVTNALQTTTDLAELAVNDMVNVAAKIESVVEAIAQITEGLDQVSSVVQSNSATSEQSAAASEELSSQAQVLRNLVSQFQLPRN